MFVIYAKQYIPFKPTRWGLKVWLRCDSVTGFCHQVDLYLGRDQYTGIQKSVGHAVVEKLIQGLEEQNLYVCFDNFLTSIVLAESLLQR
jgi:hypothetical protein